jgi:hypothetical protein
MAGGRAPSLHCLGKMELLADNDPTLAPKPAKRDVLEPKKPTARSRVGNGKGLLSQVDLRGSTYREYCDVCADLAQHMGGADQVTAVERILIQEVAGMVVWCRRPVPLC